MKYRMRFSKYDIQYRNELGHYLRDDWTSFWDIGKICEGVLLTLEDYERLESQFLKTLEEFIKLLHVDSFRIRGVDYHDNDFSSLGFPVKVGATVTIEQFLVLAQLILREELWMSFDNPKIWINFVGDYHVFLGFNQNLDGAKHIVKANHLFWEKEETVFFDYGDEDLC